MTIHVGKSRRVSWSLAMIVRDAEAQIGQVLDDASAICDELVVVDTGSIDATKEIAMKHGARVVDFQWIDDFAAARNVSFEQCTGDWILWLDADDRVPPDAQQGFVELKTILAMRPEIDVAMVPYQYHFSQVDPTVCTFTQERERVVRRSAGLRWVEPVHEFISVSGRTLRWTDAWVEHRPRPEDRDRKVDRNLRILDRAVAAGDRSSRTLFYFANELRDHERWDEALAAYEEYFEGAQTVVWERYSALLSMATCSEMLGQSDRNLEFLHAAIRLDGTRAEAFLRIGLHYYNRQEWERAVPFLTAATSVRRPVDGFIDDTAYTWGPWDYLAVCHSELEMYEDAVAETLKALRTSSERPRLFKNMEFYIDQLRAQEVQAQQQR